MNMNQVLGKNYVEKQKFGKNKTNFEIQICNETIECNKPKKIRVKILMR